MNAKRLKPSEGCRTACKAPRRRTIKLPDNVDTIAFLNVLAEIARKANVKNSA